MFMMDLDFVVKDKHHGTLTVKRCWGLHLWEKIGEDALQKSVCEVVDTIGFQLGGTWFNPRMKVTPVKLPPRKDRHDIACQWEFAID
jgi:hypothetical protein